VPVGSASDPPSEDPWTREALRLHDRYLNEVVLAFDLCPWADKVLREGAFRRRVIAAAAPAPEEALAFVDALAAVTPAVDIGFLIFPRFEITAPAFDAFVEKIRRADRARRAVGQVAAFLMAAFHPEGQGETSAPHRLIPLLRRSPDPTVQLVRAERLDQVRGGSDAVSNSVARNNQVALERRGQAELEAIIAALRNDRDKSYRRVTIGEALAPT
jgi:hypothetical protein